MWENMKFRSDKGSGSFLAAYFVFSVGMVLCTTFVLLSYPGSPEIAGCVLGILAALGLISLLLRRAELPSTTLMGIFGSRRRELYEDYIPQRRRPKSLGFGTNHPPTVEDIREAADGPNNWVPTGPSSGRRPVRKPGHQ